LSVKIRLKRMGSKKKPFYRFVATDSRNARDGRFIETLGYYNPRTEPPNIKIDEEAVLKWMERGAKPSPNTESLFRKLGFMQKWQLLKQGVKKEDLEQKIMELKAKSTPPQTRPEKVETTAEDSSEEEAEPEGWEKKAAEDKTKSKAKTKAEKHVQEDVDSGEAPADKG
jgi:small subunit ribosomal protein S16